jgi:DNA-binding CsgD family transcriptional regulator/PAS domain-containing protein
MVRNAAWSAATGGLWSTATTLLLRANNPGDIIVPRSEELFTVIESVYAAGLDAELWPKALASITQLVGGVGTTMEIFDRRSLAHLEFFSFGVPKPSEIAYLDHYVSMNPRISDALPRKGGDTTWDYRVLDEKGIDRSEFYGDFLAPMDMRYTIVGILKTAITEFGAVAVQRSARQGHVDRAEIALMERLSPHVSQAMDMTRRLRSERRAAQSLEHALDWLADGVAVIRADGSIAYANEAFQAIARAGDGIRTRKSLIEFAATGVQSRFGAALAAVQRLRIGDPQNVETDFPVPRQSGNPPYVVSVRPLPAYRVRLSQTSAVSLVFVHDPLERGATAIRVLREVFGLTAAEASVAQALQTGVPLADYAREHLVTINTVYTHLRRLKEKMGSTRMAELIRKLNDLQLSLRDRQDTDC